MMGRLDALRHGERMQHAVRQVGANLQDVIPPTDKSPCIFVVDIPSSKTPTDIIAICQSLAKTIEEEIPPHAHEWAWSILAMQSNLPKGTYAGGWIDNSDKWIEEPEETPSSDTCQKIYDCLLSLLNLAGRNNAIGEGDFWLLDDDYGFPEQRIYIFRMEILTDSLVRELQELLKNGFQDWTIRIVLDLLPPDEDVPRAGLLIHSGRVEEQWDREALKKRFGDQFKA